MIECKHEFKKNSIKYDKKYGRVGICKVCGKKIFAYKTYHKPKTKQVKMKKKERRKLNKEIRNENNQV